MPRSGRLAPRLRMASGLARQDEGIGVELNDGIHSWTSLIQPENTRDVELGQFFGGEFAGGHLLLQLGNSGLVKFVWN